VESSNAQDALSLEQLLQSMRAQLQAGVALARQGVVAAERDAHRAARQFFQKCVEDLEAARAAAHSLGASFATNNATAGTASGEHVSSASFAPGDGANDAQVTPEEAHGKPGNWPAY
jgi:hypothetical protein